MAVVYQESIGSTSPGNLSFSFSAAQATWPYYCTLDDLEDAITDLLGSVETGGPSGALRRVLPRAHPLMPWLYASGISSIVGMGASATNDDSEPDLEAPSVTSTYYPYPRWKLNVQFNALPYAVLDDSSIDTETITVYDDAGSSSSVTYPREYYRYTTFEITPIEEYVTAQHGQMAFYTSSGAPGGNTFPGHPRILLPDSNIVFRWLRIPYRYLWSTNSKIMSRRGRVNQATFLGWPAGSLLYVNFKATPYVPPVPDRQQWLNTTTFSTEKLFDCEFYFRHTTRTAGTSYTPSNASWAAAGHNLEPWLFNKSYYYVGNQSSTAGERVPKFLSFCFSELFKNPDA